MKDVLNIQVRNCQTSLPRILRIIHRQGFAVEHLVMTLSMDSKYMFVNAKLNCTDVPELLVKLLEKQTEVVSVESISGLSILLPAM